MNINWIDDEAGLAALEELSIYADSEIIEVKDIDKKASRENRARKIPLDESRVEGIQSAISKGIPIPKLVVRRTAKGYVIVGGNHRFASLNGETTIPAHVIECTDSEFEIACRLLNTVVGCGMTKAERIEAAIDANERLGVSRQDAARMYGIAESTLRNHAEAGAAAARLSRIAPRLKVKLKPDHIKKLGLLAGNDNILKAAAAYISEVDATAVQLAEVAKTAREKKTEAAQVAVFEEAATSARSVAGKKVPRMIRVRLFSALKTLESLKGKETWESVEVDESEIQSVKTRAKNAIAILSCLCKASG